MSMQRGNQPALEIPVSREVVVLIEENIEHSYNDHVQLNDFWIPKNRMQLITEAFSAHGRGVCVSTFLQHTKSTSAVTKAKSWTVVPHKTPAGLGLFPATLINWILSVSDWFRARLMFNVDVVFHWFPTVLTCELLEQNYVVLTSVCTFTGYNQFLIVLSNIVFLEA